MHGVARWLDREQREPWRRGRRSALAVLVILLLGNVPSASAQPRPKWSIRFTGAVDGAAKRIRAECFSSGKSGLVTRAEFKVDTRRYTLTVYFAPQVEPGSRAFGASAGPSTTFVSLTDVDDPSAQWISGPTGSGTVESDRRSGSVDGELLASDGSATQVSASFDCHAIEATQRRRRDLDWSGPVRSTVSGSTCNGEETGTMTVIVVGHEAKAAIEASGSYSCPGVTVPTAGGVFYSGRLEHGSFRFRPDELFGVLLPTWNCSPRELKIPVRHGVGSIAPKVTAASGDVYACDIELREVRTG